MRVELSSSIQTVTEIEDCIRASKKYTKSLFSRKTPLPTQGDTFPSHVVTEHYEVYPDLNIEEQKSFWDAALTMSDWLWGDILHIDVTFKYNYNSNKAWIEVYGGAPAVTVLTKGIPGLGPLLNKLTNLSPLPPSTTDPSPKPAKPKIAPVKTSI
jgi:hypothetical protein